MTGRCVRGFKLVSIMSIMLVMSHHFTIKLSFEIEDLGISFPNDMPEEERLLRLAMMLAPRLERLTPDSSYAHQASGCRRSLLRISARLIAAEKGSEPLSYQVLEELTHALNKGFEIIQAAGRERISRGIGAGF